MEVGSKTSGGGGGHHLSPPSFVSVQHLLDENEFEHIAYGSADWS